MTKKQVIKRKDIKLLKHQYELVRDTETKIIGLVSGYGGGKTYAAARKAIQLSILNAGYTGIVTEPTIPLVRDIFLPEMESALSEVGIKYVLNKSTSTFFLYINGKETKIICTSLENYERLIGINAAWVICDEFDTSKVDIALKGYQKLLGRLRTGNVRQFIITTTPEGFKAAYQIFVKENTDGKKKLIKAKTTDNKYLPEDFIETLKEQYPPNLLKAYLEGEFVNLTSGNVYCYFDRYKHHTDLELTENDILYIGQDFNIGGCFGVVVIVKDGIPYAVDEYSVYDTQAIIEYLKKTYPNNKIVIIPDASAKAEKTNSSKSDLTLLREAGFKVDAPSKNPRIIDRVNSVNNLFYKDKLFINTNKCPQLTEALEQQAWTEKGEPEKFDGANTIDDRNDALGYVIYRKFGLNRPKVTIQNHNMV